MKRLFPRPTYPQILLKSRLFIGEIDSNPDGPCFVLIGTRYPRTATHRLKFVGFAGQVRPDRRYGELAILVRPNIDVVGLFGAGLGIDAEHIVCVAAKKYRRMPRIGIVVRSIVPAVGGTRFAELAVGALVIGCTNRTRSLRGAVLCGVDIVGATIQLQGASLAGVLTHHADLRLGPFLLVREVFAEKLHAPAAWIGAVMGPLDPVLRVLALLQVAALLSILNTTVRGDGRT